SDAAGNFTTCTQQVTVSDTEPPSIACPADVTAASTRSDGTCVASPALGSPVVHENCGAVTVTNDAPATFTACTATVTWTATDAAGRASSCVQHVTITPANTEVCDGIDNNGNGQIDEGFPNFDGDSMADCVDPDDDNDGVSDVDELAAGSNPRDP